MYGIGRGWMKMVKPDKRYLSCSLQLESLTWLYLTGEHSLAKSMK